MIAAFIPWLAIRLVVEFMFRSHFMAPLTLIQTCAAGAASVGGCNGGGSNGGMGISAIPPATGHIGDLVLSIGGNSTQTVISYQPAGRFWTFQFIEAGIFVALTAVALGAAIWLLRRRPA